MTIEDITTDSISRISIDSCIELSKKRSDSMPDILVGEDVTIATATATATTISTSIFSALESCHSLGEGGGNPCPLLRGVSIDRLPLQFRKLLIQPDPSSSLPNNLGFETIPNSFFPGHIPGAPWWFIFVAAPFVMGLTGLAFTLSNERSMNSGAWTGIIVGGVIFVGPIVWIGIAAYTNYRKRAHLFSRDSDGARKPWPGDWKAGTYLVGGSALVDFDGSRAWLYPVDSITRVDHFKRQSRRLGYQTTLVIRSPNELENNEIRHKLDNLEEPHKGREIQCWHQRCTRLEPLDRMVP